MSEDPHQLALCGSSRLLDLLSSGSTSSGSWTGGWTSGGNLGEEITDIGRFEGFGEKHWPVWLNGVS